MAKIDFWKKHNDLRNEILSEIGKVVDKNNGEVAVPYYYDYDETNPDVMSELEEDYLDDEDYDIREGYVSDNVEFDVVDYYNELHTAKLISVCKGRVLAEYEGKIDTISLDDVILTGLINIYEAIAG
jgi:hypothetical protein